MKYDFILITNSNCEVCGPYKEKLKQWGVKFIEANSEKRSVKNYCRLHDIMGTPNLIVLNSKGFVINVPGAVQQKQQLLKILKKVGVEL